MRLRAIAFPAWDATAAVSNVTFREILSAASPRTLDQPGGGEPENELASLLDQAIEAFHDFPETS